MGRDVGLLWLLATITLLNGIWAISSYEKAVYRNKVVDMFFHAYHSYMDHAYPADELMPLTCKGRVRGRDRSRGDIDDALGMFSLTLVDTLDTLAVLGHVDEFNKAIKTVVRDVSFDRDIVVSVFETNIRILGGLLGAHFAAEALKEKGYVQLSWYNGHLLRKAREVGERLLPAFNTATGLPYPKVNLRHGMSYHNNDNTTCTACAGTMLMEFAALSRVTGDPKFEVIAHQAMEVLWQNRHHGHNLLGTIINVQSGEWLRRDSGVGAGSDSYYEYCLKSYILLGDQEYLKRFQLHYKAIMKYISNGPMLVDVSMNSPTRMTRSYMDSLLAFWPGLQVLWGDVDAAIHTHDMLYHITERHNFLPEAFTLDFRVHWGNHPLRPEFSESTYFLYKATGDPYYLDVGKTIVDNLNEYARVCCGFAAIKDLRNNEHEDRMDSFVLAETFKYLFLLFAEEGDTPLDMDDFVFSTEAHLFPLSLASINSTLNEVVREARVVKQSPPTTSTNTTQQSPPAPSTNNKATPTQEPITGPSSSSSSSSTKSSSRATPRLDIPSLTIKQLQCPNDRRPFVIQDEFEKLVLRQCTSSRFKIRPPRLPSKRVSPPRLNVDSIDFNNREHLTILSELGIVVEPMGDGRVQVSHLMQKAKTPADAEEGWFLMQDIMKFMNEQKKVQEGGTRTAKLVQILHPNMEEKGEFKVGPALFGPDLGVDISDVSAELYVLPGQGDVVAEMGDGCQVFSVEDERQSREKVVMMARGGCLFIQKVRNAQNAGATGAIIADRPIPEENAKVPPPFSMSGDGVEDVTIPSVFMKNDHALFLLATWKQSGEVVVKLAPNHKDKTEEKEDQRTFNSELGRFKANIEGFTEYQRRFLESIKMDSLKDGMKENLEKFITEELQKLKQYEAGNIDDTIKQNLESFLSNKLDKLQTDSADVVQDGLASVGGASSSTPGGESGADVVSQSSSPSDGG